ncbi:Hit family protein 1 [Smittium culicis]|uniref:Hit family protein 1 n=2 Tax=Smittium culicis TaxID=133412 RepID=A0A1R1YPM6_9FUNG|nr:Hit family protein 1 [Smittium culicis]OMJ28785.1 Hit family protein 1 [Smittium culicis]
MAHLIENCLFCKIIKGVIPSVKLLETELSYAFLDIGPLSKGHALVIPKYHAEKTHQVPDEYLADILPQTRKLALAMGLTDYNILQNNGAIAHQEVMHVHYHLIPKPDEETGLKMHWKPISQTQEELKAFAESVSKNLK